MADKPYRRQVWLVYCVLGASAILAFVAGSQIRNGVLPFPIAIFMLVAALCALFVIDILLRWNRRRAGRYEAIVERARGNQVR
ncbi:MAG: hypothetical protein QGG73_05605 [Candidatus Hydrogenedentes bacterium]|jgi:protein-S-isoprenylcysteine O-methyltransferase Ste14|nr:hypothetical protein [Candidatus Hydrogenedentota bacterium]